MDKIKELLTRRLPEGSFLRNVATLMTGTVLAQALTVLTSPLLTRIYSPDNYGILSLFISIMAVLAIIAGWRYELAIVLPEKDEDAANLLVLSILIAFGMGILTLIAVAVFHQQAARLLNAPELDSWLWLLPISLFLAGLFQAFNYWSTRRKQFGRLAVRQITQSTVTVASQITAGLVTQPVAGGLIGGSVLGQLAATSRLGWQIAVEDGRLIREKFKIGEIKKLAVNYKNFPIYSSWSALLNSLSAMLPSLMLGYFFNTAVVGYYALGQKILSLPMGVVGNSIAQVFFPRAADAQREGNLSQLAMNTFNKLLNLGLVPILLISLVAPDLFSFIFGSKWLAAGQYVRWLSPWFLFVFIASPISTLYDVLGRQRDGLIFNTLLLISRIVVLWLGGRTGNDQFTIALFGITGTVFWIFNCFWLLWIAGNKLLPAVRELLRAIFIAVPYIILPLVCIIFGLNAIIQISAAIIAGIVFSYRLIPHLQTK
ncbi:MAG TPA: oligosaccharide flippase family protein [Syntrophomonadaceae bacterium]|nr:oligosaccharide flippase family protein [Syntrophomonadaceae bacterium]